MTRTQAGGGARGGLILATLILGASVANLNMSVANVALPTIDRALGATQTQLDLVAVGFTLGLATSVLYLGALADRHGRKLMLLLGLALSVPAAALAAWSGDIDVLILARIFGGVAAGMAFPTTLSLITALLDGTQRTRGIALWSGFGGGAAALGPLLSGLLLEHFWWGSVFAVTIPLAVVGLVLAAVVVPRHADESKAPVDDLGGVISVLFIGALVLAINMAPVPGRTAVTTALGIVTVATGVAFFWRQRRAANPLFDLHVAARRTFWVAAVAGIIVFGALMGSLFIGQQFLQDVLGKDALHAGAAILPTPVLLVLFAPVAARLILRYGARLTLVLGFVLVIAGFAMMLTWHKGSSYLPVGLAYAFVGAGVGLAGPPATRSIMGAVPVRRAGMGSATTDLQRDLGGAIMQSVLGALLTLRYSAFFAEAFTKVPAQKMQALGEEAATAIANSFGGAADVAKNLPQADAAKLMDAAERAFTEGSHLAVAVAIAAALGGLALVLAAFPGKAREQQAEAGYAAEDGPAVSGRAGGAAPPAAAAAGSSDAG
jgi:MFS transporter, DHA2 family, multidrug resistance protein